MMLSSKRPYLFKAWYDWIVDNNLTPYIIVNASYPKVQVPKEYVKNGRIVLDISPPHVRDFYLEIKQQVVAFQADFEYPLGVQSVFLPTHAILAIYAEENKEGIFFAEEESSLEAETEAASHSKTPQFVIVE